MTLFLSQLWNVLQDDRCKPYIHWNSSGDGFIIPDVSDFENNVLPIYYKHNFLKNPHNDYVEYTHPHFRQGHPESLAQIVRKPTTSSRHPASIPPPPKRATPAPSSYHAPSPSAATKQAASSPAVRSSTRSRKRSRAADGNEYDYLNVGEYGVTLGEDEGGEEVYDGYPRAKHPRSSYEDYGEHHDSEDEEPFDDDASEHSESEHSQHNEGNTRGRHRSESISGLANVLVAIAGQTIMPDPAPVPSLPAIRVSRERSPRAVRGDNNTSSHDTSAHTAPITGRTRRPSIHVPDPVSSEVDTLPQASPLAEALRAGALDPALAEFNSAYLPFNQYLPFMMTPHGQQQQQAETPVNGLHSAIHPAAVLGALVGVAAANNARNHSQTTATTSTQQTATGTGAPLTRSVSSESVSALIAGAHRSNLAPATSGPLLSPTVSYPNTTSNASSGSDTQSDNLPAPASATDDRQISIDWFRSGTPSASPVEAAPSNPSTNGSAPADTNSIIYIPVPVTIAQTVYKTFQALTAMSPSVASTASAGGSAPSKQDSGSFGEPTLDATREFLQATLSPRAPAGPPPTSAFNDLDAFRVTMSLPPFLSQESKGAAALPTNHKLSA